MLHDMKEWIRKQRKAAGQKDWARQKAWMRKNKFALIMLIPGIIGGYAYWYFIGCTTGTCPITSSWYGSAFYGIVMGFVLGNLVDEQRQKKNRASWNSENPYSS